MHNFFIVKKKYFFFGSREFTLERSGRAIIIFPPGERKIKS